MNILHKILFCLPITALSFLASCDAGNGSSSSVAQGDTIQMKYARNLTMVDYGDYIKADFRNPWDTTRTLHTFILVPRDREMPSSLPEGKVIKIPVEKSIIYTSVHNSLVEELGALDAITGICDTKYIHKPAIRERLDNGTIADCGTSMAPNVEKILMIKPDVIMLSAFENSNDHNKIAQIGIPIVQCTDYMEVSPLARAEWMRFYGRLYGKGEKADSMFRETEKTYNEIKAKAAKATYRPMVLNDLIFGQAWHVPGAYSTIGVLIEDAGGRNPFADYKKSGSVQLSPEEVLLKAKDSDVWMIKYSQDNPMSVTQLGKDNDIYKKFKCYAMGNVYGCDATNSAYFEESSFHPQWVLCEYVSLLHPEIEINAYNPHYYTKLKP